MANTAEISEYDTEELERQLGESRRELFNLRFQLATGQLDNFSRITHVKKDVARMMTELRIREIAEAEGMALEDLPVHQAAARRRSEDEALGRSRTTASERRAAAKAAEEEESADVTDDEDDDDLASAVDEDELEQEMADDDGMARPVGFAEDAAEDGPDDEGSEEKS
jgi:large subunit ribosomal protein L29